MASPKQTEPRKQPKQERSRVMYRRILDASIRILRDEGALGFTTTKVAHEAGISVGSLYQYFPNKHALIAALHDEDIGRGWATANELLEHPTWSPRRKLIELTRWFFETEAEEANTLGVAMGDMQVFLRGQSARNRHGSVVAAATSRAAEFIAEGSTIRRGKAELEFGADFLFSTVEAVAASVAGRELTAKQRRRWADNTANMLADYLALAD